MHGSVIMAALCVQKLCVYVLQLTLQLISMLIALVGAAHTPALSPAMIKLCRMTKGAAGIQTAIKVKMAMSNPRTIFPFVKIIITILVAWRCSAHREATVGGREEIQRRKT